MRIRRRIISLLVTAALLLTLALPVIGLAAGPGPATAAYDAGTMDAVKAWFSSRSARANLDDVDIVDGPEDELWLVGLRASASRDKCATAEQLITLFDPEVVEAILVTASNGSERGPEDIVGTGDILTVYFWDGDEADLTIIVTGDVLGTGVITIAQVVRMAAALNGSQPFNDLQLAAAAWGGEGFGINSLVQEAQMLSGGAGSTSVWQQTPGEFVHRYSGGGILVDVSADGTFSGNYHVMFRGDTGPGYPNGTRYYCDFAGSFSELQKRAEAAYECRVTALTPDVPYGTEYIATDEDGTILNVCEPPWSGDQIFLFGPGCALSTMESFCDVDVAENMLSGGKLRDGIWLMAQVDEDGYTLTFNGMRS